MTKKVLKVEITDDEMIGVAAEVAKLFPNELFPTLGLYSATIIADIFKDANEVEVSEKPKVTSPDTIYHSGDHTFRVHRKANGSFSIDHFDHGVFKDKEETESQKEAFKYILAILANHLI